MGNNDRHGSDKTGKCNLTNLHRIATCFTLSIQHFGSKGFFDIKC